MHALMPCGLSINHDLGNINLIGDYRWIDIERGLCSDQAASGPNVPAARSAFGVNGAGVKVGVFSDSVNRFQGGLPTRKHQVI